MTEGAQVWQRATLALRLLGRDAAGLGGLVLRARSGPVRDLFLDALTALGLPLIRLHPAMSAETLLGGLDLAATLQSGHRVDTPALVDRPGVYVLAMAERCPPDLAALLAQALDRGRMHPLVLLDEGAEGDEHVPACLSERLAFHADLTGLCLSDTRALPDDMDTEAERVDDPALALTLLAARFGIDSLRAPRLALRTARALATDPGALTTADIRLAAELVYPHRATMMPQPEEPPSETPDTPPPDPQDSDPGTDSLDLPEDLLIEAVRALLPAGLLAGLRPPEAGRPGAGSGAGQRRKGNRRGRPLPARRGRLDGRARIDLVATLRAAAPWQKLRKAQAGRIAIWPSDIHVKRYEDRSDRLLVFAVDASGSAALARLAEAKGAVELLLAQAYSSRDHVALIAFRGDRADLLLPPTRSLVQTKRRLAALPGGGGTPLAAALLSAGQVAQSALSHGLTPVIALLTDGKANIALDGRADRATAQADAERQARWLRGAGFAGIVLDVGRRPHAPLQTLAATMGAQYLPLPRADARGIGNALRGALG
ncbi:magnesium chelatase subunit D [Maliponia aquimaris]|uniref:Magnesium-chelatase 60 kDa subunit n=1 Tax=Maliponia aquimaris TaxID=1673631 RepID=A0A238JQK0_9RHOB|nr:magnesium chelatase subunit D [Maliponia aquimaris]SMX32930.1 Magnesium-chelatase 60 kDa subunit [Maliponia aquimaris]